MARSKEASSDHLSRIGLVNYNTLRLSFADGRMVSYAIPQVAFDLEDGGARSELPYTRPIDVSMMNLLAILVQEVHALKAAQPSTEVASVVNEVVALRNQGAPVPRTLVERLLDELGYSATELVPVA